jgi:GxxExxY protein
VKFDALSNRVIGCAIEVHRQLGPGLLESVYRCCLAHELHAVGLNFEAEKPVPVRYKGVDLDCGFRIDILVENELIVELKSVNSVLAVHEAQVLTYLRLANVSTGLLVNFNSKLLRSGIRRFVL